MQVEVHSAFEARGTSLASNTIRQRFLEEEVEALSPRSSVMSPAPFRALVITARDWPPDALLRAARRTGQLEVSVSLTNPSARTLSRPWDVIVVVAQPGESGADGRPEAVKVIELLRRHENTADTPILLLDVPDLRIDYARLARLGVRRIPANAPGAVQAAMALHLCWSRPLVEGELARAPEAAQEEAQPAAH
jgi:hypothetical protein